MSFRAQYLADIDMGTNPYPHAPAPRVSRIYGTARRGSISAAFATRLWQDHLQPMEASLSTLPANQPAFDQLVVANMLAVEARLQAAGKGGFGVAQKIVNLFMKDLWALGLTPVAIDPLLHAPIDRGILGKLAALPATWDPWTRAVAGMAGQGSPTVCDYLAIQDRLRGFLTAPTAPGAHAPVFATLIEMEQFLWHRI